MLNKDLQELLRRYPDNLPVKIMPKAVSGYDAEIMTHEHVLLTSETAYLNEAAPEEEWDTEDGKIELGDGQQYLLINPIIY